MVAGIALIAVGVALVSWPALIRRRVVDPPGQTGDLARGVGVGIVAIAAGIGFIVSGCGAATTTAARRTVPAPGPGGRVCQLLPTSRSAKPLTPQQIQDICRKGLHR